MNKEKLKLVRKYLAQGKVVAVHIEGCKCVTCTYNYPDKEGIVELVHFDTPMPFEERCRLKLTFQELDNVINVLRLREQHYLKFRDHYNVERGGSKVNVAHADDALDKIQPALRKLEAEYETILDDINVRVGIKRS